MCNIDYLPEVVEKQIPRLTLPAKRKIKKAIEKKLMIDPVAYGKPLRFSLKGLRRLRVENYRVIYKIDAEKGLVIIVRIAHRKEVYE